METSTSSQAYNDRLFKKGFRKKLHEKRFKWVAQSIQQFNIPVNLVFELGCFDAKTINYLPQQPRKFTGYDADWEGALTLAENMWRDFPEYKFYKCLKVEDIHETGNSYDLCLAMETLEHVVPDDEEKYIKKMHDLTKEYIIITVPNETGVLFLLKYIFKELFHKKYHSFSYSIKDIFYTTIGKTQKVERNEHKGYNFRDTINLLAKDFEILKVEGIQSKYLPVFLNFNVGIICKKRFK